MRLSQLRGRRLKERPREVALESHALLLRGGYVRQVAGGIFSLLHPGLRVVHKIEGIISCKAPISWGGCRLGRFTLGSWRAYNTANLSSGTDP